MRPLALLALAFVTSCTQHPKVRDARDLAALDAALVSKLDAPSASDRVQAAFALGELGIAWRPASLAEQVEAEAHLVDRLAKERDATVKVEIVAALGRVGRSRGRTALLGVLAQPGPARARAGLALSHLYRRLRDHDLDPLVDLHAIEAELATPDVDVRRGVIAALAAMNRDQARASLRRAMTDADPICRAVATDGLAVLSQPDDVPALEHALADDDERVASFAARGIARLAERGIAPTLAVSVLHRHSQWVKRPAVIVALANEELLRPELAPFFAGLVKLAPEPGLACLAALAHDRITGKPELIDACPAERNVLVGRLYAEAAPGHVKDLEPLLTLSRGDDQARALAASAMGRYDDPRVRSRLLELASDSTPRVWGAAAEGASAARLREAGPILLRHLPLELLPEELDYVPSLFAAIGALAPKGAADALRPYLDGTPGHIARSAQDALATLLVKSVIHPAPAHPPYDALAIPAHPVVRLETTRGVVRIQLDPIAAPRTVRNFIGLVQKKFYDGITWHRVVPGFVVQGGDPRGDGSGGAGWFIPCEPNDNQYKEGTVGMALDGLDSGSSQFFVTLSPEPRLEGKYTAFGDVLDGMATLRQLVPDDRIIDATLEPETPPTPIPTP